MARKEAQKQGIETEVSYVACIIDPKTASNGEDYMAYNVRRWGSDGWCQDLRVSGEQDGAAEYKNWVTWPNTIQAHRALEYVEKTLGNEVTDLLHARLFDGAYELGENISNTEAVIKACQEILPDKDWTELQNLLNSNQGKQELLASSANAWRQFNIKGVPKIFIGNREVRADPNHIYQAILKQVK